MSKPVVAIVGRKNVGKSTLLNRIAGKRISIVEDLPGTTRDRITVDATWSGRDFTLIDTGGMELDPSDKIDTAVNKQIQTAISEADILIFLVSARDGLLPDDHEIANRLRGVKKPVLLAVNKAEDLRQELSAAEFYRLGLGDPMAISAYHGRGVADLLDKLVEKFPESEAAGSESPEIKIALVGKPNVGKSTLLNTLAGEERVIVDERPGTTRDAIDTLIDYNGQRVILIDTAGIKRQGRIEEGVERYSVLRSREAIERADIALLLIDASQPISAQDTHIAGFIQKAATGVLILANKWDLTKSNDRVEYIKYVKQEFNFIDYASVLFISAKSGEGTTEILPSVIEIYQERTKRLPTSMVNNIVLSAVAEHEPPRKQNRRLRILYATQAAVNPPTFVFSVNDPTLVHFSYERYLENRLRQSFGFKGTPIRMVFKPKSKT